MFRRKMIYWYTARNLNMDGKLHLCQECESEIFHDFILYNFDDYWLTKTHLSQNWESNVRINQGNFDDRHQVKLI